LLVFSSIATEIGLSFPRMIEDTENVLGTCEEPDGNTVVPINIKLIEIMVKRAVQELLDIYTYDY